jgi:hypothetical protein
VLYRKYATLEKLKLFKIVDSKTSEWYKIYYDKYELEYGERITKWRNLPSIKKSINLIEDTLKQNNIRFDLSEYLPSLRYRDQLYEIESIDLISSFNRLDLSPQIKYILTEEQELWFYELSFKNYIHQYFLRGKLDWYLSLFLFTYINGYDSIEDQYSRKRWLNLIKQLKKYNNGTYQLHKSESVLNFNTSITIDDTFYQEVFLAGFSSNTTTDPFHFTLYNLRDKTDSVHFEKYLIDPQLINIYLDSIKNPENEIRLKMGLPKIGEGWITETKLFNLIKNTFDKCIVLHHGRPKWLEKQHLDVYLPEHNIAIEYQGKQHYQAVEFFGGEEAFAKNQMRDLKKRKLCVENKCTLICISSEAEFPYVIDEINRLIN